MTGGETSSTIVTVGGSELQLEYQFQVQAVVEVEGEVFIGERSGISTVPPSPITETEGVFAMCAGCINGDTALVYFHRGR